MDMMTAQPVARSGFVNRLLLHIAGVDEATLRLCPQHDWDNARAVAQIMICTWLYQTGLFSIISHRLFAAPGQLRPELLITSAFLATFILLIDSYMVMRSGWHLSGIEELKRGGIDISGGVGKRLKAGIFLAIRIILSIGIAQLTAIFFSLMIFGADITARLEATNRNANAILVGNATTLIDGNIQQAADAVKTESAQEAALAAQVTALRQNQIDPSANDAQLQLAQQEVGQLQTQKGAADQAVQQAETFASNELGGIKGAPGNSGIPGPGPRRQAALEAVSNAKDQDQQIGAALEAAQDRLDALRSKSITRNQTIEQQSHAELPAFQNMLSAEDAKLTSMKGALAVLESQRDDAIRTAVEGALGFVPYNNGLLTQITVLDQIAHENRKIEAVIILVDVTSFGFELAAVRAKVTSYVPTTYAALLARSAYMQVVRLVDEMMEELNAPSRKPNPEPPFIPPIMPQDKTGLDPERPPTGTDPFSSAIGPLPGPPKRRRGRPRKTPPAA
jgi:hypothetical protein